MLVQDETDVGDVLSIGVRVRLIAVVLQDSPQVTDSLQRLDVSSRATTQVQSTDLV